MSSKRNHALRSHKTHANNYSMYKSFVVRSSNRNNARATKKSFAERIASLIMRKHQDR